MPQQGGVVAVVVAVAAQQLCPLTTCRMQASGRDMAMKPTLHRLGSMRSSTKRAPALDASFSPTCSVCVCVLGLGARVEGLSGAGQEPAVMVGHQGRRGGGTVEQVRAASSLKSP